MLIPARSLRREHKNAQVRWSREGTPSRAADAHPLARRRVRSMARPLPAQRLPQCGGLAQWQPMDPLLSSVHPLNVNNRIGTNRQTECQAALPVDVAI